MTNADKIFLFISVVTLIVVPACILGYLRYSNKHEDGQ
jgi:hypothetical protein